jgi:tetratricopeptide (TPR) repeat protein
VLVLDDLHAADTPSLLLLQYVARQLESSRLLVLGAFRDVDPVPNGPLTAMLAEVAREPGTRRLSLRGLSHQDVADYVTETAVDLMRPELVRLLHDETEGNPLFVGEMVRLLVVEGTTDSLQIPQTVRDVIARRLAHLSDECNRVLVLASVMGREFEIDALARLAGVDEQELLETLDEAMTARVVSEVPGGSRWLRFAHVLIRDTLYDSVTSVRRVRLHRLAAKVLEELYGEESGPHLAELAHHAVAGSEFEKGLRYARVAADRALALLAYEEAGRLSTMALEALDLCDPDNEATRCQLLLSRGEAEIRAGDTPTGKQTFLDAAAIARQLGLAPELARAAFGYAGRIVWSRAGADHRVVPLLEEGLTALRDSDVELRVRLLARLAGALRDEHSRDRRDAISLEAVELARRCGSAAALAYALDARAHAITAPDTVAEILELGTELRELAGLIGDREKVVAGHMLRSMAQLWCGKVSEAVAEMATAGRIAEELRQPAQLWLVHTARAMLALARGEITQAEALAAEALLLGERAQPDAAIPHYWMHRYITADFRGVYDDVEHEIHALASDHPTRPVFRCVLGHLVARQRRYDEAGRILAELRPDRFAALPFDQEWLFGTSLLAETAALLGDVDAAQVLYDLIMPWARFDAVDVAEGTRGSMDRYLGLLATTLEAWDHATKHFEAALEANSRNRLRPWLAYTEYDYARMHLARDEEGDAERAAQLIGRALATFGELGMAAPIDLRGQFA